MQIATSAAEHENEIGRNIFIGRQPVPTGYMDGKMDVVCPYIYIYVDGGMRQKDGFVA